VSGVGGSKDELGILLLPNLEDRLDSEEREWLGLTINKGKMSSGLEADGHASWYM
jgi:hypothetical protein